MIWQTLINAGLVALAGSAVAALVTIIRSLSGMRRDVSRLVQMDVLRAGDLAPHLRDLPASTRARRRSAPLRLLPGPGRSAGLGAVPGGR